MKTLIINRLLVWILGCAAWVQVSLFAQGTLVAPNEFAGTAGNTDGTVGPDSIQQIYASSQFANAGADIIEITGISFRLDEKVSTAQSVTIPSMEISLSTTARSMANLAANPIANRGSDAQVVFSGKNLVLSGSPRGAIGTAPFNVTIKFDSPFFYDWRAGQLVFDYAADAPPNVGLVVDAQDYGANPNAPVRRVLTDFSGSMVYSLGFITQFSYVPIPEPSTSVLAFAGLLLFVSREVWFTREGAGKGAGPACAFRQLYGKETLK